MISPPLDRDLDDEELVELERFLSSPSIAETSMELYSLDGFFAAILSGPRTSVPSEWLPWIWDCERGERSPEFETVEQAQRMLGLVMRHYNSVARALMDADEPFEPIYPDGDIDAAISWCAGYLTGVSLDPGGWEELVFAKPRWFGPILSLGAVDEEGAEPGPRQLRRWSRQVGRSVVRIHGHWLQARQPRPPGAAFDRISADLGQGPAGAPRVGRNDPCPCGSGKKHKRCCGASAPS